MAGIYDLFGISEEQKFAKLKSQTSDIASFDNGILNISETSNDLEGLIAIQKHSNISVNYEPEKYVYTALQ